MSKDAKKTLVFSEIEKLHTDEPEAFLKLVKSFNGLESKFKKAQEVYKESHQDNGKVIHVLRSEWIANQKDGGRTSQTYPEYHEAISGDRPTSRGYQCAVVFGFLVIATKSITEEQYDDCMSEYITKASEIIGKTGEKIDHPAVQEVIRILRRHAKTAINELKALKARFAEKTEGEGDDEKKVTVFLTEEEAEARRGNVGQLELCVMADEVAKKNPGALVAALDALVRTTDNLEIAKLIAIALAKMPQAFTANVDKEKVRRFSDEMLKGWIAEAMPARLVTEETLKSEQAALQSRLSEVDDILEAMNNSVPA